MKGVVNPNFPPDCICKPKVLENQKLHPTSTLSVGVVGFTRESSFVLILKPNPADTYGSIVPDFNNL